MVHEKEELLLIEKYKAEPDNNTLLELYDNFKGLFFCISKQYMPYMEQEDLLQECFFGLIKAIETFKETEGSFSSYLARVTQGHLYRIIQKNNAISVPEYMLPLIREYESLIDKYNRMDETLTDNKIMQLLNISKKTLKALYSAINARNSTSLNAPIGEDGAIIADFVPDPADMEAGCIDDMFRAEVIQKVHECVERLPEADQEIITKRYFQGAKIADLNTEQSVEKNRQELQKAFARLKRESAAELSPLHDEYIYSKAVHGCGVTKFRSTWTSSTEAIALKTADIRR